MGARRIPLWTANWIKYEVALSSTLSHPSESINDLTKLPRNSIKYMNQSDFVCSAVFQQCPVNLNKMKKEKKNNYKEISAHECNVLNSIHWHFWNKRRSWRRFLYIRNIGSEVIFLLTLWVTLMAYFSVLLKYDGHRPWSTLNACIATWKRHHVLVTTKTHSTCHWGVGLVKWVWLVCPFRVLSPKLVLDMTSHD